MPTDVEHFAAAAQNQALLSHLLPQVAQFPDWVTVVAFYKAMHLVEAVLFLDWRPDQHAFSHEHRNRVLKENRRYEHINKHYFPLWNASIVARYLQVGNAGYPRFTDYLSAARIQSLVIDHYLHQVEQGVARVLGTWPAGVPRCKPAPPPPPSSAQPACA